MNRKRRAFGKELGRREFLRMTGVAAAGAALAACAPSVAPSPTAPAAPNPTAAVMPTAAPTVPAAAPATAPPQVTFSEWSHAEDVYGAYTDWSAMYNKLHPNVTINNILLGSPGEFDKLEAALIAGSGIPDIADVDTDVSSRFLKGKIGLLDLSDRLKDLKDQVVPQGAFGFWEWQEKIYGVCFQFNAQTLAYRHDLYDKAGVKAEDIKTWDDFVQAGLEVVGKTGAAMIAFNTFYNDFATLLQMAGTGGYVDANGKIMCTTDTGLEVLQFMSDLVHKYKIAIVSPQGTWWNPAYFGALADGKIASHATTPWYMGMMKVNVPSGSGLWHLTTLPTWKDQKYHSAQFGGTAQTITNACKYPDVAFDFIKFCNFTLDAAEVGWLKYNWLPSLKAAFDEPWLVAPDPYFDNQKPGEVIKSVFDSVPDQYISPQWAEIADAVVRLMVTPVLEENKSVTDVAKDFNNWAKTLPPLT